MSSIPALVASIDGRLDKLAIEMSTLHEARAALSTRTPGGPTAADNNGRPAKRPPRSTPQATRPALKPRPAAADSTPEQATTAPTASKPTAKPRRRRSPATGSDKRASSISAEQLEQLLADAASGLSASTIAAKTGVGHSRVLGQLRALEAAGQVRRTGNRRSTRWLLITDEDRIAQRTAELERQLNSRRHDRTQRRGRARVS